MLCILCWSQVVGVAQAINKKCGDDGAFTEQDEKVSKAHNLLMFKETSFLISSVTVSIFTSFLGMLSFLLIYFYFHATAQSYILSLLPPHGARSLFCSCPTGLLGLFGLFRHRPAQRSAVRDVSAGKQTQSGGCGFLRLCDGTDTTVYVTFARMCVCVRACTRTQVLLDLASLIFEEQQCLEVLLRKIAGTILSFMQAQACTVFIADEDSMVTSHNHTC